MLRSTAPILLGCLLYTPLHAQDEPQDPLAPPGAKDPVSKPKPAKPAAKPSSTQLLTGGSYTIGPATLYLNDSVGWDANPAAWQYMFVGGTHLAITKDVDLYLEYVFWEVLGNAGDSSQLFENGYQIILNWRF